MVAIPLFICNLHVGDCEVSGDVNLPEIGCWLGYITSKCHAKWSKFEKVGIDVVVLAGGVILHAFRVPIQVIHLHIGFSSVSIFFLCIYRG